MRYNGLCKSTLIRLILGFEKPSRGSVYIDGRDISGLDLRSMRRHIGSVLQSDTLLNDTILSNILLNNPSLTEEQAWEAARIACIADDIEEMPMKMQTVCAEGGGSISGGQRQRILIARAIADNPGLLIFDEATSALDNEVQKSIASSQDRLNCTRLVIAHRLSTIRNCDRILVMDKGEIVENGTYEELMEKKGLFYELAIRQTTQAV